MRLVNWNVERPTIRSRKNIVRVNHLLSLNPDIVVLTETNAAVDLSPSFHGFLTESSYRKPREGEAVAAIWVSSAYDIFEKVPTIDPTEAVCIRVGTPLGECLVYASIIPYAGARGRDGKSKRWEEHTKAIEWHREDWLQLRNTYPTAEMICAGDYNQHLDGVGKYGTHAARAALLKAFADARLTCVTTQDFIAMGMLLSRRNLDHVAVSEQLAGSITAVRAWEGTVSNQRLSDHNGVTVDFLEA